MAPTKRGTEATRAPELAYRWLRDTIVELPREQELFLTESEIAESSGLSRTPVREALLRLEAEGYVRRIPHKGAYIPAVTDRDVDAIMQARRVIEEWSVTEVAPDPGRLPDELHNVILQQETDSDPVKFIAHDLEFHTSIIRTAGNPVLTDFYRSLRDKQMRMGVRIISGDSARRIQVVTEHRAIADALAARDPERAVNAVRAHLTTTLASMTRPTRGTEGSI
ncbi:MAG: GntR family transcriptional regulator [Comamonadaceae bacterium]|nr:MAG: GntR family transcriptional regulator [Comamonadaceae bacterium]